VPGPGADGRAGAVAISCVRRQPISARIASAPCARSVGAALSFGTDDLAAIGAGDETSQPQLPSADHRVGTQRHLAAAGQCACDCTLGQHAGGSIGIDQGLQPGNDIGPRRQAFDTERALSGGRQRHLGRHHRADALAQSEPGQPGRGEDDCVVLAFVELAQTGVEVAAQAGHGKEGILRMDLRFAAQRGRPHHSPRGHVRQAVVAIGDEGVERNLALRDAGQHELIAHHHRHVLHRMHGDVGAPIEQGCFQLLHEQALAANLRERAVEDLVTARGHAQKLDIAAGIQSLEPGLDVLGLPQGETAFTGSDDDALGGRLAHDG